MPDNTSNWLRPPRFDEPDVQLRARVLHWLTLVSFIALIPLALLIPVVEESYRYSLPLYLVSIAASGATLWLVHQRRVETAARLFTAIGGAVTIWAGFASGGLASPQLSMAVLAIMLAGFLISGRAAIAMAVALAGGLLALEALRGLGLAPQAFITGSRITVWGSLFAVLGLSALLLYLFVGAMREARDDAAHTALRLAEEMQRRAASEASLHRAQKLEALGRLTGGIAHDFNNILMVLLAESEFLETSARGGNRLTPSEVGHLAEIRRSTERAAELTRQLLAFSRQQVGSPRFVDPDEALQRLESMLERLIRENVALSVELGTGEGHVRIDPAQLDQVLMNLALNASDAMAAGGELRIRTRRVASAGSGSHAVSSIHQGEYVLIEVADTGEGIPEENLGLIFDPFFTTRGMARGTGLGLASAHGIVSRAGGTIDVESTPGEGTIFRVYLPLLDGQVPEPEPDARTAVVEEVLPRRILLCEDDDDVRHITERTLSVAGHEVVAVASAEDALAWIEDHTDTLDLLISDVILPGINGVELAREVTQRGSKLPVLLISGYTEKVLEESGVPSNIELLQKPFHRELLLNRVQILASGHA